MSNPEDVIIQQVGAPQINDPGFNLQDAILKDDSTTNYREYILRPEGTGDVSARFNQPNDSLEFNFIPKGDIYNPSGIKFVMDVLVKPSAGNIAAEQFNICNDITQIFSRGAMRIGSSPPEEIEQIGMANYIMKLVGTSVDYANTSGSVMGFYPNLRNVRGITYTTPAIPPVQNDGTVADPNKYKVTTWPVPASTNYADDNAIRRFERCAAVGQASFTATYEFTLPFALFNTKKYLSNVAWTLTLQRAPNKYLFEKLSTATTDNVYPVLEVTRLEMVIPVITPNMQVKFKYDELAKKLFTLQTQRVHTVCKTISFSSNNYSETLANLPARPSKVYIAFQKKRDLDVELGGAVHVNPSFFNHVNIQRIQLTLNNSENVPELLPECNFTDPDKIQYARQFCQLLNASGAMDNVEAGSIISYDNFGSMYPIFGFKLSRNQEDLPELSNTPCKVDLHIDFRAAPGPDALDKNYNIIMVCVYDTIISIMGDSNVSKNLMG